MSDSLWDLRQVMLGERQRPRLDNVTLSIEPGVTAIVGPSGAGKTSLLNVLVGFESAVSGEVRFRPQLGSRLQLFWVPQADGLWPHLTVSQHLTVVSPQKIMAQADVLHLLEGFDLLDNGDSLPDRLSQGERSRLSLARAIASRAGVLAMDEPMAAVDEIRARRYWTTLRQFCGDTTSLVFASHDVESVVREADEVICMSKGQILYQGNVANWPNSSAPSIGSHQPMPVVGWKVQSQILSAVVPSKFSPKWPVTAPYVSLGLFQAQRFPS